MPSLFETLFVETCKTNNEGDKNPNVYCVKDSVIKELFKIVTSTSNNPNKL
jgi:hypothetical protein